MWDAAAHARAYVDEAHAQARELVSRATAEAQEIRAAARERGHQEGLAAASEALAAAVLQRDRLLSAARGEVVDLAFAVAERVVRSAAAHDRDAVVELAGRALDLARARVDLSLRANPQDLDALRAAEPELVRRLSGAQRLRLVADAGVSRGGVVVESDLGRVDGRIEVQLEALRRAVDGAGAAVDGAGAEEAG